MLLFYLFDRWCISSPWHWLLWLLRLDHFKCIEFCYLYFSNYTHVYPQLFSFSLSVNSVTQSCPTLCNPVDCSMPGFPVHHQLRELAQTHVPQVRDAIQPSHPLSSPFTPAFNLSQHQGLFQWASSSRQVAKVLEFQFPMNIQDWFPLGRIGWFSLQSKGLSRVFFNTTVLKHQFFSAQLSSQSDSHIHTWPLEKP